METREFLRNLGGVIAERRRARKLTQEKLAEALDTSSAWVSQVERGIGNPSMETLLKLAVALGTTPAALIEAACAVDGLPADVRTLMQLAQRLKPAATRVLVEAARAMEREGMTADVPDGRPT